MLERGDLTRDVGSIVAMDRIRTVRRLRRTVAKLGLTLIDKGVGNDQDEKVQ